MPTKTTMPFPSLKPRRTITGISAVLLPMNDDQEIDLESWQSLLERTWKAGLTPAINMDTGYAASIDDTTRHHLLQMASDQAQGRSFVSGVFVQDRPGALFHEVEYLTRTGEIRSFGGLPIIFQSYGLCDLRGDRLVAAYDKIATATDRFLLFELGAMFAPFGRIYSLDEYKEIMSIPQCVGGKHSSLDRCQEWERLQLRDQSRPGFMVLTGNDLAIDMVWYGSDYLLGLSAFAPDYFALRDRWWSAGDVRAFQLNDLLQYLGQFAFRSPVPSYKHSAAQFLKLRGWIGSDRPLRGQPERPASDVSILRDILERLEAIVL